MNRMRVLIVDDVPLFRAGLRSTLEQMSDCSIIGEATEVPEILELARMYHPDVVLLHGGLRFGDALEIASLLLRQAQQRGLFVLAPTGNEEQVFQFFKVGAAAYETRAITPAELTDKMRRVARGDYLITSEAIFPPHPARPISVRESTECNFWICIAAAYQKCGLCIAARGSVPGSIDKLAICR